MVSDLIDLDILYWRIKVCDSVFYFFSIFGLIAYIPSIILSVKSELWGVVAVDTFAYGICLYLTFRKKKSYIFKAVFGSIIFYSLGLFLIFILGPKGAGEIWLFSSTIIAALLLSTKGGYIAFIINILTQCVIVLMLQYNMFSWQIPYDITAEVWAVKAINYILLNLVVVIVNSIFVNGFKSILDRMITTRNATILGLAKLAEHKDNDTGKHIKRVQESCRLLALELKKNPQYKNYITDAYIMDLSLSSILHDIGKVGISDSILLKPGKLTPEEFEQMEKHSEIGYDVLSEIESHIEGTSLYTIGQEIALYHHEKWDGSGYPKGLKGLEIPLSARIVAIVDVYDALTSVRPYKEAYTHEESIKYILQSRGVHFDPEIVDAFVRISDLNTHDEINKIN